MVEFIAEIGINHCGSIDLAKDMILAAKKSGATVAKFQKYYAEKILGKDSPYLQDAQRATLDSIAHRELKRFCDQWSIEYMCSVFHAEDVPFFEEIDMERYKIASRSVKDIPLITAVNATGKPIIASNGLDNDLGQLRQIIAPRSKLSVLNCIAEYPTSIDSSRQMLWGYFFPTTYGLSSHCPSIVPSLTAIMYGAKIIEHHVRFSWQKEGPDMSSSITFEQLEELIRISRRELEI